MNTQINVSSNYIVFAAYVSVASSTYINGSKEMFTMQRVLRRVDQDQPHYHNLRYNKRYSQLIGRGVTRSAMLQQQGEVYVHNVPCPANDHSRAGSTRVQCDANRATRHTLHCSGYSQRIRIWGWSWRRTSRTIARIALYSWRTHAVSWGTNYIACCEQNWRRIRRGKQVTRSIWRNALCMHFGICHICWTDHLSTRKRQQLTWHAFVHWHTRKTLAT